MNRIRLLTVGLLGLLAWGQALALSSDRDQPAHIEADRVDYDQKTGIMVYTGHVEMTQGSMHASAEKATVYTDNGALTKIVANGRPVTYRQRPDGKDRDVRGHALRMEYYADRQQVILLNQAELQQGGNTLKSKRIVYDAVRDIATAGSAGSSTVQPVQGAGEGGRVRITLQPRRPAAPPPTATPEAAPTKPVP